MNSRTLDSICLDCTDSAFWDNSAASFAEDAPPAMILGGGTGKVEVVGNIALTNCTDPSPAALPTEISDQTIAALRKGKVVACTLNEPVCAILLQLEK